MSRNNKILVSIVVFLFIALFSNRAIHASSVKVMSKGMRGDSVALLQNDLKKLGFMSVNPTGYYGKITESAVRNLQKKYKLKVDGIAGPQTLGQIDKLLGRKSSVSRSGSSNRAQNIIDYSRKFLGVRYVWGGSTAKGFDCSGFVKYVFKHFGITLNRTSRSQATQGVRVKKADLKPGNLVFFDTNGGLNRINHVGIYIGDGKFIHSSSSHKGVVISNLNKGFYSKTYMTARRVL
ncbi:MAG: NlpC/P60 family protein [Acetivibrionales bacterium]|jgi:peptidoglycan endopeptidase LytE